jgi:hypothetical protein
MLVLVVVVVVVSPFVLSFFLFTTAATAALDRKKTPCRCRPCRRALASCCRPTRTLSPRRALLLSRRASLHPPAAAAAAAQLQQPPPPPALVRPEVLLTALPRPTSTWEMHENHRGCFSRVVVPRKGGTIQLAESFCRQTKQKKKKEKLKAQKARPLAFNEQPRVVSPV